MMSVSWNFTYNSDVRTPNESHFPLPVPICFILKGHYVHVLIWLITFTIANSENQTSSGADTKCGKPIYRTHYIRFISMNEIKIYIRFVRCIIDVFIHVYVIDWENSDIRSIDCDLIIQSEVGYCKEFDKRKICERLIY